MNALRPYQKQALSKAETALRKFDGTLVVLPTGSGKTRIFSELAKRWNARTGKRVLVVEPRRDLVLHAAENIRALDVSVDVEMAEQHANGAPVVVGTAQSIGARLRKHKPGSFGLLIYDEADLAAAPTYRRIAAHFRRAKRYGCTATPSRFDGLGIGDLFPSVAYKRDIRAMINGGHLVRVLREAVEITRVERAKLEGGDFDKAWLDKVFSTEKHLHLVVQPLLERAETRPTIVFGTSVRHAELLAELFNRYRPGSARAVSGNDANRDETMAAFRRGEFQFLCNCVLVNRGVDVPFVSCIGMARPTFSQTLYLQMLGRGTRPAPDKSNLIVVDFTLNSDVHPLNAYDAIAGSGEQAEDAAALAEESDDADVVSALDAAEDVLGDNAEVRKRIRAKVLYRMRRVVGIDWLSVTEKMWRTMTDTEIGKTLGCTGGAVSKYRPANIRSPGTPTKFDPSAVSDEMWKTMSSKDIGKRLGFSGGTVGRARPFPQVRGRIAIAAVTAEQWRTMSNRAIAKLTRCGIQLVGRSRPEQIPSPESFDYSSLLQITDEMWRSLSNRRLSQTTGLGQGTLAKHRPKHILSPGALESRRLTLDISEDMWRSMNNQAIGNALGVSRKNVSDRRPEQIPSPGRWSK